MRRRTTDRIIGWLYKGLVAGIFAFVLSPLVLIVPASFNEANALEIPTSFSLKWYVEFFQREEFITSFLYASLPIAAVTAFGAFILGIAASYAIVRGKFTGKTSFEVVLMLPLVIPSVTTGVALLVVFTRLGLTNTYWGIIIGHVLISLPYVLRTLYAALEGLDVSIEEAARTLGASSLTIFREITLPLAKGGILASMLFAFSISFTDVNISIFLVGWRVITFPVLMFHWINYIHEPPLIAAMTAIQVAMILIIGVAIDRIFGLGRTFRL